VKNTCWSFANAHFRKGHEEDLGNIKRRMGAKGRADAGTAVRPDFAPPFFSFTPTQTRSFSKVSRNNATRPRWLTLPSPCLISAGNARKR